MTDVGWQTLRDRIEGKLVLVDDDNYSTHFKPFNSAEVRSSTDGNPSRPLAVLFPRSAKDVSKGVQFATQHELTLSVKSGGYNPSNWSSAGQLVVDLSALRELHLDHVPTEAVNRAKRRWDDTHDEVEVHSEQETTPRPPVNTDASPGALSKSPITHPNGASSSRDGRSRGSSAMSSESGTQQTHTVDIHDEVEPPPSRIEAPASANPPSTKDASISGLPPENQSRHHNGNQIGRAITGDEGEDVKRQQLQNRRSTSSSPMQLDQSVSTSSAPSRADSGTSNRSSTSNHSAQSSSNGHSPSMTCASSAGRGSENSPDTTATSASTHSASASSRPSERMAGKRRMLDRDHDSSQASPLVHASTGRPLDVQGLGQGDAVMQGQSEERRSPMTGNSMRSERSPFVLANSYPPLNLANADLPPGLDAQSLNARHRRVFGSEEGSPSATVPFNYDVTKGMAHLPNNIAPPGAIPPFPATGDSQSQANNALGSYYQFAPNATLPPISMSRSDSPHSRSSSSTPSSSSYSSLSDSLSFGAQIPSSYITVTFGSGVKAKELDEFTSPSGYFVPLACYPVGSAIFTTGGYGFVSRLFGLSMDITLELEIVLPISGKIVHLRDYQNDPTMSAEEKLEQEELWFACRGAGTAFGIVTKIKAKAFKIGKVLSGNIIYPYNPITTPSLIKHWRDCLKNAPRELYTNLTLTAGPTSSGHVIVIQFSWCGRDRSHGDMLLQAILSWEGERCLMKDVEVRPYAEQQVNVSQILASKEGTRWLVRSTLTHSLTDDAIHQTVKHFHSVPCGTSWLFEIAGGAIAEPPYPTCYPISHRTAAFQLAALHQWNNSNDDDGNKESAERWIYGVFGSRSSLKGKTEHEKGTANGEERQLVCGPFPCFLASGEGRERMISVYGRESWNKLAALKRKYDPKGLLRYTHFENELLKEDEA